MTITGVSAGNKDFADDFGADRARRREPRHYGLVHADQDGVAHRHAQDHPQRRQQPSHRRPHRAGQERAESHRHPAQRYLEQPRQRPTAVRRDAEVQINFKLPNGPLNPATVTPDTVQLVRVAVAAPIATSLRVAGDNSIRLTAAAPLDVNTLYEVRVTANVKDGTGAAALPSTIQFTTGDTYARRASVRTVTDLDPGWKFLRADAAGAKRWLQRRPVGERQPPPHL